MTDTEGTAAKRRVDVAFLQCLDVTVLAGPMMMSDAEEQRLHTLLALLQDFGLILRPNVAARQQCLDFDTLLAHLRLHRHPTLLLQAACGLGEPDRDVAGIKSA